MIDLLAAAALVFVLEGLVFAILPAAARQAMASAVAMDDASLRLVGLVSTIIGLVALVAIRFLWW